MRKIIGFAPDLDIATPGIILSGTNFLPTVNGVGAKNSLITAGLPALASDCRGAAVIRTLDDARRAFAATQTKLYEATGTSWTDVSNGTYTGGAESRWRFAQYGNQTIAVNKIDPPQASASGAFADLGGTPPKASIVETCSGQVFLFDYNDGSNDYPDGYATSALRNSESWSPSIATGAVRNRLLDTPGQIRAGKAFGPNIVAYKERSMYFGSPSGPPIWWEWQLIPGDIGCVSQEAIASVLINGSPAHIFAAFDGFYVFDGTRPISIGNPLKKWYNANTSAQYRYKIKALHDPLTQTVTFYLPDQSGGLTFGVPYNYLADKWGYVTEEEGVEASVQYLGAGITYETIDDYYATYADLPNIAYESPFWTSGAPAPAIFTSDHTLKLYAGTPGTDSFQLSYEGDDDYFQTLDRIRGRFNLYPDAGTCTIKYTVNLGDTVSTASAAELNDSKYDKQIESKWFSPTFQNTGSYEMTAYKLNFIDKHE